MHAVQRNQYAITPKTVVIPAAAAATAADCRVDYSAICYTTAAASVSRLHADCCAAAASTRHRGAAAAAVAHWVDASGLPNIQLALDRSLAEVAAALVCSPIQQRLNDGRRVSALRSGRIHASA